jgi:hypothetical protein
MCGTLFPEIDPRKEVGGLIDALHDPSTPTKDPQEVLTCHFTREVLDSFITLWNHNDVRTYNRQSVIRLWIDSTDPDNTMLMEALEHRPGPDRPREN